MRPGDWIDLAAGAGGAEFVPLDLRTGQEDITDTPAGELREMTFRATPPVPRFLLLQVTAP